MAEQTNYISEVEQLLKYRYGITLTDTGFDAEEWLDRFGDESVLDAVEAFATKFNLTPLDSVTFMPS